MTCASCAFVTLTKVLLGKKRKKKVKKKEKTLELLWSNALISSLLPVYMQGHSSSTVWVCYCSLWYLCLLEGSTCKIKSQFTLMNRVTLNKQFPKFLCESVFSVFQFSEKHLLCCIQIHKDRGDYDTIVMSKQSSRVGPWNLKNTSTCSIKTSIWYALLWITMNIILCYTLLWICMNQ